MTPQALLEIESIRSALDAMRQAEPLGVAHPLAHFLSLRRTGNLGATPGGTAATDATIFHRLARVIERRLNHHRALYHLPPVTPHADYDSARAAIKEDFQHHNEELEAWSYLYYRYVRTDLDLSVDDLQSFTVQDRRTLQRRQSKAITRLAHDLARREASARTRYRQATQCARLPLSYEIRLVGRDALLDSLVEQLTTGDVPRHVLLYGPPGIGKTALALAMAHKLIEHLPLANVAWINQPDSDPEHLSEQIRWELGIPYIFDAQPTLMEYFQVEDTLLILDDAQALLDDGAALSQILQATGGARLILCANMPTNVPIRFPQVKVPELDEAAALDFMGRETQKRTGQRAENVEGFSHLYRELGGNPDALRKALEMGRRYHARGISTNLYRSVWEHTAGAARLLWLVLALSPPGRQHEAMLLDIMSNRNVPAALDDLRRLSVIEAGEPPDSAVMLTALGRSFAEVIIRDRVECTLVYAAARLLTDFLATQPDLARCLYLIKRISGTELPSSFLIDVAYTFAPVIERGGAWLAWARYLESLSVTSLKDRLWIELRKGIAYRWLARWNESAYALTRVIEDAGANGAFNIQADAMVELASVRRQQKDYESARQLAERARTYYTRSKLPAEKAIVEQVQIALESHDVPMARRYLDQATAGETSPRLLNLSAYVAFRAADLQNALSYAERASEVFAGDLPRLGRILALLAQIHHGLGNRRAAIDHLLSALSIMEQSHDVLGHARARSNLGAIYLGEGDLRRAWKYYCDLPAELARLGDVESLEATKKNLDLLNEATRRWNRRSA